MQRFLKLRLRNIFSALAVVNMLHIKLDFDIVLQNDVIYPLSLQYIAHVVKILDCQYRCCCRNDDDVLMLGMPLIAVMRMSPEEEAAAVVAAEVEMMTVMT